MLEEVELLVARGDGEVVAHVVLPLAVDAAVLAHDAEGLALAEGRVGQDDVVAGAPAVEQGVLLDHGRGHAANSVQVEVHGAQAHDLGDDVGARQPGFAERLGDAFVSRGLVALHVLVGGE